MVLKVQLARIREELGKGHVNVILAQGHKAVLIVHPKDGTVAHLPQHAKDHIATQSTCPSHVVGREWQIMPFNMPLHFSAEAKQP